MARRKRAKKPTIKDLFANGVLQAGVELECSQPNSTEVRKAWLQADHSVVDCDGTKYQSINKWGDAVRRTQSNAMKVVSVRGEKLEVIRDRYHNSQSESSTYTANDWSDSVNAVDESDGEPQATQKSLQTSSRTGAPVQDEADRYERQKDSLLRLMGKSPTRTSTVEAGTERVSQNDRQSPQAVVPSALVWEPDQVGTESAQIAAADNDEGNHDDSLLEQLARLSPSEFQELIGEYVKAKGFTNAEIEIVIKMKV